MLTWTFAAGAWFFAGIAPLCLFYFLRLRFRRQPIPSAYIWMRLVARNRGGRRLRIRSILLFLFQVLAYSCLVLAIMGPQYRNDGLRKPGTIILLDGSASMRALDPATGLSRFDEARELAIARLGSSDPNAWAAVFLCGSGARFLGSAIGNKDGLVSAIRAARPGYSSFDESGLATGIGAWMARNPGPWTGYLISDGGSDQGGRALSAPFAGAFEWTIVGKDMEDRGLGELRVSGKRATFNAYNSAARTAELRVRLSDGGAVLSDTTVAMSPGTSSHEIDLQTSFKPGSYSLASTGNKDSFPEDDVVYFALNDEMPLRTVLVGRDSPFYSALFAAPLFSFNRVEKWDPGMDASAYDLVVSDTEEIPANFPAHTISFASLPRGAPLKAAGRVEGVLESPARGRGLMRHNDWNGIRVYDAAYFESGSGVESIGTVSGKTVVAVWEDQGYLRAAFGTDFAHSELGLSWALPVFVKNFAERAFPQWDNPLAWTLEVGQPRTMSLGKNWKSAGPADIVRNGRLTDLSFDVPGAYTWRDGNTKGYVAVNIAGSERNLVPRPLAVPSGRAALGLGKSETKTDLASFFILFALLTLCAEWILWRGLPVFPGRQSTSASGKQAGYRRVHE